MSPVLGGPDIPSRMFSALQLILNNHDGYYTFGAGMALGPGSKVRLQWKAVAADAWVTRFVGSISELATGTDAGHSDHDYPLGRDALPFHVGEHSAAD